MGYCLWLQREKRLWGGGNKSCDGVRERSVSGEEGTLQGSGPGASLEDAGRDRELKSLAKGLGSNEAAKQRCKQRVRESLRNTVQQVMLGLG